jgi:hypothetical protein
MNDATDKPKGDDLYAKSSVILALIGWASQILILCFLIQPSHDSEGRFFDAAFGFILGGPILIIMAIPGLYFASVSLKKEAGDSFAWAGLILNFSLLVVMLCLSLPFITQLVMLMHGDS